MNEYSVYYISNKYKVRLYWRISQKRFRDRLTTEVCDTSGTEITEWEIQSEGMKEENETKIDNNINMVMILSLHNI